MERMTSWDIVEAMVLARPSGHDVTIDKGSVPDPASAGMHRAFGIPKGTLRHYRRPVRGVSCLHVREYPRHYEVHWDRHDPRRRPLAHWWSDVRGGPWSLSAVAAGTLAAVVLLL